MAVRTLDLYDLLAPQFALGFTFPPYIDRVLSVLKIDDYQSTADDDLVVYTGVLMSYNQTQFQQLQPQGTNFGWRGNRFEFRLTVSRDATAQIDAALGTIPGPVSTVVEDVSKLLNALRPAGETATDPIRHPHPSDGRDNTITDYPGFAFKLEILVDLLNFEMSNDWIPGKHDPVSRRIVPDGTPNQGDRVMISLPKAVLEYRQGPDLGQDVRFAVNSWGGGGIDAPHDLAVGNFISMHPGIALHRSGEFAFSVDQIILDLSETTTPPEILRHFGTSEDFEGLYFGQMLVYYTNDQGVGFNLRVNDALISFAGEVSLEGALDVFLKAELTSLSVTTRIYTGTTEQDFRHGKIDTPASPPDVTSPSNPPGRATVLQGSVLHVEVNGGEPPYTIAVFRGAGAGAVDVWDSSARRATFDAVGEERYLIVVSDGNQPSPRTYAEWLTVDVRADVNPSSTGGTGTPADRPADPRHQAATLTPVSGFTNALRIDHRPASSGDIETLTVPGTRAGTLTVKRGGTLADVTKTLTATERSLSLNVPNGATYQVELSLPGSTQPAHTVREVTFNKDDPFTDHNSIPLRQYLTAVESITFDLTVPRPTISVGTPVAGDARFNQELLRLNEWLPHLAHIDTLAVDGFASLLLNTDHDQKLSENRRKVGLAVAQKLGIDGRVNGGTANSNHNYGATGSPNDTDRQYQCFRFTATFTNQAAAALRATLGRPTIPAPPPDEVPVVRPDPPAGPPQPNEMPTVLNRLGFRVRFERNELVLLELSGELDFDTALEQKLRAAGAGDAGDELRLVNGNGQRTGKDGVVDFRALYTYDTATSEYGVGFALGSHPEDPDGLVHMVNGTGPNSGTFKNILGALALFAPIINSTATSAATNSDNAGAWIGLGVSLAVPIAVGGMGVVRTRRIVLYGGEIMFNFNIPEDGDDQSFQVGIMFDYGVEFDVVVPSLGIGTDRDQATVTAPPLKVRYKGIGFALHHHSTTGGLDYSPVFDSSKGYDLQLSDPSLFSMDGALGNLFGITAARLARFNPLTLELDLAIKQDLGVITVDKLKVKIPLEDGHNVQIMPSGVKVNIPGTLIGNGFVNIIDQSFTDGDGNTVNAKGIEGGLDLTVVPMKLRVAGNVGITSLEDTDTGRKGVGVFVGLRVEFPSPIVLGASGLGLYGVLGLFAMHYRRIEDTTVAPTDPIGPALKWLVKAEGDPTQLQNTNGRLWGPAFDRWSFGVGVILGTMDTGFTANFQGMFVLELPGPRVLIMVKMKFISAKPEGVESDANQMTTGIIVVIDLDFEQQKITIGVLIDFEIEEVLQLQVPIEILFKLDAPSHWHLWLGTYTVPISADILGIARGSAYFMIQGHELTFPTSLPYVPSGAPILGRNLPGVAIALGMEASLLYGSRRARLYLEIGAGFHVGLSFKPFILVGSMFFRGELMLFIASIGARGNLDVEISRKAADPYYIFIRGKVCGSIDLWFFEIKACIEITVEKGVRAIEPPPLFNGLYLQSYAPVLASGQGGSRPIDASLGNAAVGLTTNDLPVVPIDTIPVLQLSASPTTDGLTTFTENPGMSPDLRGPGGWVEISANTRVKYDLTALELREAGGAAYADANAVPATWRVDTSGEGLTNGGHRTVDLALFSRVPVTADRAIERSEELRRLVEVRWGNLCTPPAPPAPVFYTFCGKPLGPSSSGWNLRGMAKPDPAGTLRESAPEVDLRITENRPAAGAWDDLMASLNQTTNTPARVVGFMTTYRDMISSGNLQGFDTADFPFQEDPDKTCVDFTQPNSSTVLDLIRDELVVASDRSIKRLRDNIFRPVDTSNLSTRARLDTIIDPRRLGTIPTGRATLNTNRIDDRFLVNRTERKTTITHDDMTLTQASLVTIDGIRGVRLGRLGLQFRRPVCRVEITFSARVKDDGYVAGVALNAAGSVVDKQTIRLSPNDGQRTQTLTLEGEGIVTLTLSTKLARGVITNICYYRNCDGAGATPNLSCFRALQLPYPQRRRSIAAEALLENHVVRERIERFTQENRVECLLDLHTGRLDGLVFCAAVYGKFMNKIFVEELDGAGKVVHRHRLGDLPRREIRSAADVPTDWLNAELPWRLKFLNVAQFLYTSLFDDYGKYIFTFKPKDEERCETVRFVTSATHPGLPAVYLAAAELLRAAERERQAFISARLQDERRRVESYLGADESDRPLLRPDTIYHLTARYAATVETTDDGGDTTTQTEDYDQTWSFRTDDAPPAELKPYVLGTTPELDAEYHFFNDPVKVVFNDRSTPEMYGRYGKTIRGNIRRADGAPIDGSPDPLTELAGQDAEVLTPYREFVQEMVDGGNFACLGGSWTAEHGVYVAPFKLQPLMAYTFDLEILPAATVAEGDNYVPPFRRSFRTGRYADVGDFATAIRTAPVYSFALPHPIPTAPAAAPLVVMDDVSFEKILTDVGFPLSSRAEATATWLLWEANGSTSRPAALFIDAAEPLWRTREVLRKTTIADATLSTPDPSFQIWETGREPSLEVVEKSGGELVRKIIRSTGGTRALFLLDPARMPTGNATADLHLELFRPGNAFYGLGNERATLLDLSLTNKAPWE